MMSLAIRAGLLVSGQTKARRKAIIFNYKTLRVLVEGSQLKLWFLAPCMLKLDGAFPSVPVIFELLYSGHFISQFLNYAE